MSVLSLGSNFITCVYQKELKMRSKIYIDPLIRYHLGWIQRSLTMLRKSVVSPRPLTLSASVRLSTTLSVSSPVCSDEVENGRAS